MSSAYDIPPEPKQYLEQYPTSEEPDCEQVAFVPPGNADLLRQWITIDRNHLIDIGDMR